MNGLEGQAAALQKPHGLCRRSCPLRLLVLLTPPPQPVEAGEKRLARCDRPPALRYRDLAIEDDGLCPVADRLRHLFGGRKRRRDKVHPVPKLEGATDVGTRFAKSLRHLQRCLVVLGREVLAAGDAKAVAEVDAIHVRSPAQIALYFCNNPGFQQSRGGSMQCIMKMEWPERRLQSSMNGSLDSRDSGVGSPATLLAQGEA